MLTALPCGLTVWLGFLYIGLRASRVGWQRAGAAYGGGLLATVLFALASPVRPDGPVDTDSWAGRLGVATLLVHARAPSWDATDWPAIVAHYDQLLALTRSPVVEVNRAVAVSFADGPDVALPLLDGLADRFAGTGGPLAGSHLLLAARADVRRRLGRTAEAADLYRAAIDRAPTAPERALLHRRLAGL